MSKNLIFFFLLCTHMCHLQAQDEGSCKDKIDIAKVISGNYQGSAEILEFVSQSDQSIKTTKIDDATLKKSRRKKGSDFYE